MLGTQKMLNKWWLLFPCASKLFGAYRNSYTWVTNSHKCMMQMSVLYYDEKVCKHSQQPHKHSKYTPENVKVITLILLSKITACFVHT